MSLKAYRKKRNFSRTAEPRGKQPKQTGQEGTLRYTIQKHAARRLHYDFRLQIGDVMKSWAVPKGPSLDPDVRSLAVEVEDHPLEYADFEGIIPKGEYGGGTVMVWDRGSWQPEGEPARAYKNGKINFTLSGEKLHGKWSLIRMREEDDDRPNWLLRKQTDDQSRSGDDRGILDRKPSSVLSGRDLDEIGEAAEAVWIDGAREQTSAGKMKSGSPETTAVGFGAADLSEAVKKTAPKFVAPQLASLVRKVPEGDGWLHELKLDGYRMMAVVQEHRATLLTRKGNDWTERFPAIDKALRTMGKTAAVFDGEIVALRKDGTTDFQALQNSLRTRDEQAIVYYMFDLLYYDGYDLTQSPLVERRKLLREVIESRDLGRNDLLRFSDHIEGQGAAMIEHACRHSVEGIVSKRADAPYHSGRGTSWVKVKCLKRQEFVIGGYSAPSGSRVGFGALLLGYHNDEGQLLYAGRVGTGFNHESLREISEVLDAQEIDDPAFANPPTGSESRDVTWVAPELVAEVEFSEWTADNRLRHPSFQGLREDKPPEEIMKEEPVATTVSAATRKQKATATRPYRVQRSTKRRTKNMKKDAEVAGVRLSNPDRVLFPEQGITKLDLARFYEGIADRIVPAIRNRPLSLVRCPQGRGKQCFFQKHFTDAIGNTVKVVEIEEKEKTSEYLYIDELPGLISLVQLGTLEIHPWSSKVDCLEQPDMVVFDLDPGDGVSWKRVVEAAGEVRDELADHGLKSFARLTGGKGIHVVVPLEASHGWDEVKQFAHDVAKKMAGDHPDRYIATMSKAQRKNKVFIDYLRNARGATAIASYSTRARSGAPVATPIRWDELGSRSGGNQYTVNNLNRRLASLKADPWQEFGELRQKLPSR